MSQDNVGLVKADIIPAAAREAHQRAGACVDERRFVDSIVHARRPPGSAPTGRRRGGSFRSATSTRCGGRTPCAPATARSSSIPTTARDRAGMPASPRPRWASGSARAPAGRAWHKMSPGDGPIEMRIGPSRSACRRENAEVVWCDRIDPCRAIIHSVPLPESEAPLRRSAAHDGEARGRRQFGNDSVPVFDELDVLERSAYGTWEIVVRCADPEQLQSLIAELKRAELGVEDWTGSVQMLCAACSLGEPHDHQERDRTQGEWQPEAPRRGGALARRAVASAPRVLLVALRGGVRASGAMRPGGVLAEIL